MIQHSIIIPACNATRYLHEALGSVVGQLGATDEVLVVENGSTDDTRALVEAYPDARVRLVVQAEPNLTAARNLGIRNSRGKFISFLDHDDLFAEGRQRGLHATLMADPGSDASIGRVRMRYDEGGESDRADFDHMDGQHVRTAMVQLYMFRRELIERVGPFDETLCHGEDADYLLRAREGGMRVATYEGESFIYRRHESNMTRDRGAVDAGKLAVAKRRILRMRALKSQ